MSRYIVLFAAAYLLDGWFATPLLPVSETKAPSCRAFTVLGAYSTQTECEAARPMMKAANPSENYRCIQCE